MWHSLVASVAAVAWTFYYSKRLALRWREAGPLVRKAANLGLCYGAFAEPVSGIRAALRAGLAAFCCAAYDLVTDGRAFDPASRDALFQLMRERVPGWAVDLTADLYAKETSATVATDGLERGVMAVEFITGVVGSRSHFQSLDLHKLGILCQIVDDVLDEQQDWIRGEANCLHTPRRRQYLETLLSNIPTLERAFGRNVTMTYVLRQAASRATALIDSSSPGTSGSESVPLVPRRLQSD